MPFNPSIFVILGLVALANLAACGAQAEKTPAQNSTKTTQNQKNSEKTPTLVTAAVVKLETKEEVLTLSGTTRAHNRAKLTFNISGYLQDRTYSVGDVIKKGQILAKIKNTQVQPGADMAGAKLAELSAQLEQLERDTARVERLVAQQAASREELEQVKSGRDRLRAGLNAAQAQVREAKGFVQDAVLRAPFNGTVQDVFFENGEFVPPGAPVLVLAGSDGLEVEVGVPEQALSQLAPKQTLTVNFPLLGFDLPATLTQIGDAGSLGRLFPVILQLPSDGRLKSGMTAEVRLASASAPQLTVPMSAIIDNGSGQARVMRVQNNKIQSIAVTVGAMQGTRVVVTGGVQAGDLLVTSQPGLLLANQAVKVSQAN